MATPIEQEVNGVENMLYMSSQVHQRRPDVPRRDVRARHRPRHGPGAGAEPRGASPRPSCPRRSSARASPTKKKSPSILLCVNLISPDRQRYDQLYLSNYATIQVKDALARLEGVGDVTFLGAARLQHARLARSRASWPSRNMTAGDVIKALREQNVQVAAGRHRPAARRPPGSDFQLHDQHAGPAARAPSSSPTSSSRRATTAQITRVQRRRPGRAGRQELRRQQLPRRRAVASRWPSSSCPAPTPWPRPTRIKRRDGAS